MIKMSCDPSKHLVGQQLQGLLVWQDFPAGDGRALPLWDAARGVLEQPHGGTAGDETECRVSTRGKWFGMFAWWF